MLSGLQQPAHLIEAPGHRAIDDAIGVESHDRIDILNGQNTGLIHTDDITGIKPRFIIAIHFDSDQLKTWMSDNPSQRSTTHHTSGPLYHSEFLHCYTPLTRFKRNTRILRSVLFS